MRLAVVLASAACSAALAGDPTNEPFHIDHVGLVAPDILGVTLSACHVEYGRQIPYVKQEGDVVCVFWDPMVCEYTIHKPMAGQAYVWGYLAARAKISAPVEAGRTP